MSDVKIKNDSGGLIKDSSDLAKNSVTGAEDVYAQQVSRPSIPRSSASEQPGTVVSARPLISTSDDCQIVHSTDQSSAVRSAASEIIVQSSYQSQSERNTHLSAETLPETAQPNSGGIPSSYRSNVRTGSLSHARADALSDARAGSLSDGRIGSLSDGRTSSLSDGRAGSLSDGRAGSLSDGRAGSLSDGRAGSLSDGRAGSLSHARAPTTSRQEVDISPTSGILTGPASLAYEHEMPSDVLHDTNDLAVAAVTPVSAAFEVDTDGSRGYIHPRKINSHQGIINAGHAMANGRTIKEQAAIGVREMVSGTGGENESDRNTVMIQRTRRTLVRGSVALYGANKYRMATRKRISSNMQKTFAEQEAKLDAIAKAKGIDVTSSTYQAAKQKRKEAADKIIKSKSRSADRRAMVSSAAASVIRDQGDRLKTYEDTGDNLALEGLVDAKDTALNTYYAVQSTRRAAAFTAKTISRVTSFSQKIIAHVKAALSQVSGLASKAAAGAPVILGAAAIFLILAVVSSLIPTFSLKTEDTTLTKLYKYCTNLDATFSEAVSKQLNRSGFYRIDFYQNGAKSNGTTIWSTETDLDMLLAYYDAMFEDYSASSDLDEDEIEDAAEDAENADGNTDGESDSEESESAINSDNYGKVKKYSKNLWEDLYSLSVGTHIETSTSTTTDSDGKTHTSTTRHTILDVYVETKSLMQLANANARPADAEDVIYDDVFDTPFGYLTSSQQDVYDVLSEVGTYTALEDVANPFADPDAEDEPTWSVARRYGYYIDMPSGNYKPQLNKGLYISAQSGDNVFAGFSGEISISGNSVTIKTDSREITYGNLSGIQVSSGDTVTSGQLLGSVGDSSPLPSPALYVEYERNGKELNPRFFISGCLSGNSSGVGNGDIVQTALSQVGTTETPVNQVMYNDWYYGHHVGGIDYPWCAAFVSWCAEQNGYISAGIVPKSASCSGYRDFYTARGEFHLASSGYVPKAGDFVLFSSGSYPQGGAHIGIVISCDGSYIYTVEGNTSNDQGFNPDGGGVWTKSHAFVAGTSTSGIWGYCSPSYPASSDSEPPAGAQKIGNFQITHYCPCAICNGRTDGLTASGTKLTPGRTIAVDSSLIPLGSTVWIEGYGTRIAEDTGGAIKGKHIDMLVSGHTEAYDKGVVYKDVYIVK